MMPGECVSEKLHDSRNYLDSIDIDSTGTKLILGQSSLAGNTWDGGLTLLSIDQEDEITKYSPAGISTVRFSGSNLILAARDDGTVAVYSALDLDEIQVFNAHDDVVSCVADSPWNESHFGSCSWDGSIHMWDWQTKATPVSSYFTAHQGHVNAISFSPFDPQVFISVGWDGYARQWDKRIISSSGPSSSFDMDQISSCVTYNSADANTFLVGTDAGDISVCDIRALDSPNAIVSTSRIHKGRVRRILASPTKSSVCVSASDDTTYAICSTDSGSLMELSR
jgi:WD40 repeat protein